jgi:hypothetical protein
MADHPTDAGLKPPAKADETGSDAQGAAWKLFGVVPRGWSIVILAIAAWVALVLIVLGFLRLFSG